MSAKAPVIAKQKKESEFLKQKAGHYQKLVSAMTVCYSPTSTVTASTDGCHFKPYKILIIPYIL